MAPPIPQRTSNTWFLTDSLLNLVTELPWPLVHRKTGDEVQAVPHPGSPKSRLGHSEAKSRASVPQLAGSNLGRVVRNLTEGYCRRGVV